MTQSTNSTPKADWKHVMRFGMSVGLGVAIGRETVATIWPGQEPFWASIAIGAAVAGSTAFVVALMFKLVCKK